MSRSSSMCRYPGGDRSRPETGRFETLSTKFFFFCLFGSTEVDPRGRIIGRVVPDVLEEVTDEQRDSQHGPLRRFFCIGFGPDGSGDSNPSGPRESMVFGPQNSLPSLETGTTRTVGNIDL